MIRKYIFLLATTLFCGTVAASEPQNETDAVSPKAQDPEMQAILATPAMSDAKIPEYVYCEIIANHLPTYTADRVLFDFGQATGSWEYNWLKNDKGEFYRFNSAMEALNYMVCRGWEFAQAYTSGETNQNTHMLLRLHTSRLTEGQRKQLLEEPIIWKVKYKSRRE